MQGTIELVKRQGGVVAGVACIIELALLNGIRRIEVPVISMVSYDDLSGQ